VKVYYFDPGNNSSKRPWKILLGNCTECHWDNGAFNYNNDPINDGVIIIHHSKLDEEGIDQEEFVKYLNAHENVTAIVVSGSGSVLNSDLANLYIRKAILSYESNDPFSKVFARFCEHLNSTGERIYRLLEPEASVLLSMAVVCQAYAAAAILNGEIKKENEDNYVDFIKTFGWDLLPDATKIYISEPLDKLWPRFKRIEWWWASLGIAQEDRKTLSEVKYKYFLANLIHEVGMENSARNHFSLNTDGDLTDISSSNLLDYLKNQTTNVVLAIIALLNETIITADTVKNVYTEINEFLG